MSKLKFILRPSHFSKPLFESIKTAREFFLKNKKREYFPEYKEKIIKELRDGAVSFSENPEEDILRVERGELDREIERMLSADKEAESFLLSDPNFNELLEKIKQNQQFGPNVLALPLTKMYIRYPSREDLPNLLNLVDSLSNPKLKDFLRGRNIDLGKLLNDYAEKEEEGGLKVYELFTDYLTKLESEIKANWLIQILKTDAAMGEERNLPPFNQVEAFRRLPANDPIRLRIIAAAELFEDNKSNPAVSFAIKNIVKKKLAAKESMKELAEWLERTIDSALNSSDDIIEFLMSAASVGNLADVVYQEESVVVLVVHHEIALATLFPMAQWCILPLGWGGGRNMWGTYLGGGKTTIQFAIMDFSKSSSNNMRCWAFTYDVRQNRITNAHAKDDANILPNFDTNQLTDIFTKKESITGYPMGGGSIVYDDSETFTIPATDLAEITNNLTNLYNKTVQAESTPKLRTKSGTSITDFSTSEMFTSAGGLMREFIGQALKRASARAQGGDVPSFISRHKPELDMILAYLAADVYSSNYKNNIRDNKPTLADTFINPFIKPTGASKIPYIANGSELSTYLVAVMKASKKFTEDKIHTILRNLNSYLKILNRDKSKPFHQFQIAEIFDAFKVYLKSLEITDFPIEDGDKKVKDLVLEDTDRIIKFIDNITNK